MLLGVFFLPFSKENIQANSSKQLHQLKWWEFSTCGRIVAIIQYVGKTFKKSLTNHHLIENEVQLPMVNSLQVISKLMGLNETILIKYDAYRLTANKYCRARRVSLNITMHVAFTRPFKLNWFCNVCPVADANWKFRQWNLICFHDAAKRDVTPNHENLIVRIDSCSFSI